MTLYIGLANIRLVLYFRIIYSASIIKFSTRGRNILILFEFAYADAILNLFERPTFISAK